MGLVGHDALEPFHFGAQGSEFLIRRCCRRVGCVGLRHAGRSTPDEPAEGGHNDAADEERHAFGNVKFFHDRIVEKFYVTKRVPLLVGGVIVTTLCWLIWGGPSGVPKAHAADAPAAAPNQELAALRAEVERLKGIVPDQSHAMRSEEHTSELQSH